MEKRKDEEVVPSAAVDSSLQYAHAEFQKDEEVVLAATHKTTGAWVTAAGMKRETEVVLAAGIRSSE